MEVMRACMFEYHFTTLMWRVRRKSYSPHTERDRFMTCRGTSHFDSMGGIHAYTCMCVLKLYHVIPEHDLCIYHITNKKIIPSEVKLTSLVVRQRSDGPSGPTDGKHRYR